MLFSCEGNLKGVQQMDIPEDAPQSVGTGINLKYIDSGQVVATLKSETMRDFSNKEFPYREFPDGLVVEFFDEERKKNTVTANYGIVYNETGLIDLQGDVVVLTSDSTELTADQLYWDQSRNWVFTDRPNTIRFKNGAVNEGQGFDSNQEFSNFRSRSNVGVQILEEDK
jgi:LPS export ABC transporter protein LptC